MDDKGSKESKATKLGCSSRYKRQKKERGDGKKLEKWSSLKKGSKLQRLLPCRKPSIKDQYCLNLMENSASGQIRLIVDDASNISSTEKCVMSSNSSGKLSKQTASVTKLDNDSELDLYSLYSSGCITRGQISRIKLMLSENVNISYGNTSKVCTRSASQSAEKMQIGGLFPTCSSSTANLNSYKTYKALMKRKREAVNEASKSPEKKACKTSLGSVIATRTAVLPTATESEQRPVTRRQTLLSSKSLTASRVDSNSAVCAEVKVNPPPFSPSPINKPVTVPDGTEEWLQRFLRWNSKEKILVLDRLIGVCHPHEVRHMLEVIEPQFQRDFISLLPKELALYVLSFLEPRELLVAAQTCRYWRILAEDDLMWKEKCMEEGITDSRGLRSSRSYFKGKKGNALSLVSSWKAAYLRQIRIETNWRSGSKRPSKILKGHDDHVITCLQFNGTRVVSGSDDNTLKVWSATSGKCLRTLTGHTGGVWASQMQNNLIISGSTDRTLKIWNSESGQCVHTLYGHTSTVRCLALNGRTVVSGSRDATMRLWNIDSGVCEHVLVGHMAAVRCVCYDGKKVVSGSYDYMVKVWDPVTEECLHTLQGHNNRVYSLQFDGTYVVSGSLDTSIRVWEVETGTCLHTLMGHQSLTSGMELKDNILVSGNADSTVKIWDIRNGMCLKTLEGPNKHLSAVTCLQFHGKFVITSSDDGTVKLWDVKTGKVVRDLVSLDSRGSGGVVWRIRASRTKLVCAVGSRNGTEETKLLVLDFDCDGK